MTTKIDITSSAFEKGIDFAKEFLDKLIMPIVEESGLLIKDRATFWRLKNQIKLLNKTKKICKKNGISPKTISLKLLCPLLENASLEEDTLLQDKWAVLLSNLVDSEQNIENQVFPYILGQISLGEFAYLEETCSRSKLRDEKLRQQLKRLQKRNAKIKRKLKAKFKRLRERAKKSSGNDINYPAFEEVGLDMKMKDLDIAENTIKREIDQSEIFPTNELQSFELSNLIRLGLVTHVQETSARPQRLEIPAMHPDYNHHFEIDLDIDLESNTKYYLTELGALFIDACTEKRKKLK